MRKQEPDETIETFITDLKTLAANCNYGEIVDSLVRDRILCGFIGSQLRERLLRTPKLALDKCRDISRAAEITKQGISVFDSNPSAGNHAENVNKSAKANPISKQKEINIQMLSKYCANSVKNHMREKKKNVQRTTRDVTCV